ncbi:MAG: hypothetical protein OCD76_15720 [Reichenbachiella sp.]
MGWFTKKKKDGCPACKEKNITGFGTDLLESKYNSTIELTTEFPEIGIYECSKCFTKFNLSEGFYNKILDSQLENLDGWINSDLKIPSELLTELESIGFSMDWNGEQMAPCKVTTKSGTVIESGILLVTNKPPLEEGYNSYKEILFVSEISKVEPSNYGLPLNIRKATETAEELRMGFYPVVTLTPNNKKMVLNGFEMLLSQDGFNGSELTLADESWNHRYKDYLYSDHKIERTLIVAKSK